MENLNLLKLAKLQYLIIKNYNGTDQLASFTIYKFKESKLEFECHSNIDKKNYEISITINDNNVTLVICRSFPEEWDYKNGFIENIKFDSIEECSTKWHKLFSDCVDFWKDPENNGYNIYYDSKEQIIKKYKVEPIKSAW